MEELYSKRPSEVFGNNTYIMDSRIDRYDDDDDDEEMESDWSSDVVIGCHE